MTFHLIRLLEAFTKIEPGEYRIRRSIGARYGNEGRVRTIPKYETVHITRVDKHDGPWAGVLCQVFFTWNGQQYYGYFSKDNSVTDGDGNPAEVFTKKSRRELELEFFNDLKDDPN